MLSVDVHCVASSCLLSLSLLDNRPLVTLRFEGSLLAFAHLQLLVGWWRARGVNARVHEITCLPRRKMMGWLQMTYLSSLNKALLRHLIMRGRILWSSVSFGRSWPLHLASLLRMDSLALLSDCSSVRASMGLTNRSNWEIVGLNWTQVALIEDEFILLIQLLVHWLVMVVQVKCTQVILEKVVSLAGLRVINPHIWLIGLPYQILMPLRTDGHSLGGWLSHWLYSISVSLDVRKAVLGVPRIQSWRRWVSQIFRLRWLTGVYRIMSVTDIDIFP